MSYSFTGDGDPIFIHLSFLSLFHLHLIQQSLLIAQTGSTWGKLLTQLLRKYKQCLANTGIF